MNSLRLGILSLCCACCLGQDGLAQEKSETEKTAALKTFWHACDLGRLDDVKKQLEAYPEAIAEANRQNVLILQTAAKKNHIEMAKLLLEKGADPNVVDKDGYSALTFTASNGSLDVAKLLLEKGARVDVQNKGGAMLPLHFAAARNHFKIVQLILDHVAKDKAAVQEQLTARNWAGANALHQCFEFGNEGPESALLLIEAGAPLTDMRNNGQTPIHLAATRNLPTVVAKLIEKGVAVDLPNRNKETALFKAVEVGATETVKVLLDKGAKIEDRMMKLAESKDNNAVIELLDQARAKAKK